MNAITTSRTGLCCGALVLLAALAGSTLAGCGAPPPARQTASFNAAQKSTTPVTIEGMPEHQSLRQETGKPSEFTLREESSANRMRILAPPDVTIPANFPSATYVNVTGTYDETQRKFVATQVETRVPNRDQQPRS